MKFQEHCGWTNPQTWCVWVAIGTHDKLRMAVNDVVKLPSPRGELIRVCARHIGLIHDVAAWPWRDGESLVGDVDWDSILRALEARGQS